MLRKARRAVEGMTENKDARIQEQGKDNEAKLVVLTGQTPTVAHVTKSRAVHTNDCGNASRLRLIVDSGRYGALT